MRYYGLHLPGSFMTESSASPSTLSSSSRPNWIKLALMGVVALILLLVAIGYLLPNRYEISRSISINAERSTIHPYVDDLNKWPEWEPWTRADPSIKTTVGNPSSGVGANQSWTGESSHGSLKFSYSAQETGVVYDMTFDDQWKSVGAITYKPTGGKTEVTWTIKGDYGMNIVGRYIGLMMDSMVGPMFEDGLGRLRSVVESNTSAT